MLRYILTVLFLFVFISNLNVVTVGTISRYMWFLIAILSLFLFMTKKQFTITIRKGFLCFLSCYAAFLFWASFSYLRSNVPLDAAFSYITLVVILLSMFFVVRLLLNSFSFKSIVIMMSSIYVLQAATVILFFLSPTFKSFILNNFVDASNIDYLVSFRSRGISASGATLSVYLSFGFFYLLYLIGFEKRRIIAFYSFFGIALLLIAMFLSGRTGFVVFAVLVMTFCLFYIIKDNFNTINKVFVKRMAFMFIVFPLAFYFFHIIYGVVFSGGTETVWGEDKLSAVTRWVLSETEAETSTFSFLYDNHIVINTNWYGFIFGDPDFLASYERHTDIGYLRTFNDFGIVGFILYYVALLILFVTSILHNKGLSKYLLIGLTVSLFIIEGKEPFFHKHTIVASYIFLTFLFGLKSKKELIE